ncbi:MAG: alpha-glucosidase C-terminal domain-containing protein [Chloroflexaceae bacterium]
MLELRQASPALSAGSYRSVETGNPDVFAYLRARGPERLLVALNFAECPCQLDLRHIAPEGAIAACTAMDRTGHVPLASLDLRPHEGLVLDLPTL